MSARSSWWREPATGRSRASAELERQTGALARLGSAGVALAKAAAGTIANLEYGKSLDCLRG